MHRTSLVTRERVKKSNWNLPAVCLTFRTAQSEPSSPAPCGCVVGSRGPSWLLGCFKRGLQTFRKESTNVNSGFPSKKGLTFREYIAHRPEYCIIYVVDMQAPNLNAFATPMLPSMCVLPSTLPQWSSTARGGQRGQTASRFATIANVPILLVKTVRVSRGMIHFLRHLVWWHSSESVSFLHGAGNNKENKRHKAGR